MAALAAAHLASRPPPLDPVVRVALSGRVSSPDYSPSFLEDLAADDMVLRSTYTMHTGVVGDSVQLIGIVGPGLSPMPGSGRPATVGHDLSTEVAASVRCSQPGWWSATDEDYRMRVRRTDSLGRSVDYLAPIGATAQTWRSDVHLACIQQAARQLTVSTAHVDSTSGRPLTSVTFTVHNTLPFRIWIQGLSSGQSPSGTSVQMVEPGSSVDLSLPWLVTECRTPWGPGPWNESNGTTPAYVRVRLDSAPLDVSGDDSDRAEDPFTAGVFLDGQLAKTLLDRINRACQGIPEVEATVRAVNPIPKGHRAAAAWRLRVRVATSADRLAFGFRHVTSDSGAGSRSDGYDEPDLTLPQPTNVVGGTAYVTVRWTLRTCRPDGPISPPGMLIVTVIGERRYAEWVRLVDAPLLAAVQHVCDGQPAGRDAADTGWQTTPATGTSR